MHLLLKNKSVCRMTTGTFVSVKQFNEVLRWV
jgi:hypothetical protein